MFVCLLSLKWEKWRNSDKNCKWVTLMSFMHYTDNCTVDPFCLCRLHCFIKAGFKHEMTKCLDYFLNSVFSKIFSGLWDVCFGHYLATKNLNVAFCLLFLVLPNFRHAQKAKFHVTELSIFTFYFPVSCYILFLFPPPPLFSFPGHLLCFTLEGKVFMKTRRIVKWFHNSQFIVWKGEEMGWSGARLLLEFSVQPCMFFFWHFVAPV